MREHRVFIIDTVRTPWGKPGGSLARLHSADLAAAALYRLLDRTGVKGGEIGHVVFGQAHPSTYPNNIGHYASLAAHLPERVPGYTVHSNSASALQAVRSAFYLIASGNEEVCIAGGADSYSAAPFAVRNARSHFKPENRVISDTIEEAELWTQPAPMTREAHYGKTYGGKISAEATRFQEQSRSMADQAKERFAGQMAPVTYHDRKRGDIAVSHDEWLDTTGRPRLAPYADGAAAVLLTTQKRADQLGLIPRAELLGFAVAGCEAETWQNAGATAVKKLLSRHRLTIADIGCMEILENSAEDVLSTMSALRAGTVFPVVNRYGGALSFGKNDGADGIAMLLSLTCALQDAGSTFGVICMSSAGGLGMAALLKRV